MNETFDFEEGTQAALAEQARQIAALAAEIEALRNICERAQIETLRRLDLLRDGGVEAARSLSGHSDAGRTEYRMSDPTEQLYSEPSVRIAPSPPMSASEYARLVTRIRSLARTVLPVNAIVAVVSRGDEALVEMEGRIAWHFPRLDDGRWAGYHPASGDEAVSHLELARRRGARFLLIPATALWWLEHYERFQAHLDTTASCVLRRDDACRIFALNPIGVP